MPHSHKIPHRLIVPFLAFAALGFLDAAYLAAQHYAGTLPPCTILKGCERVLTSPYATVFGISIAVPGALYYLAVLVLAIAYMDSGNRRLLQPAFLLVTVGFGLSLALLALQLFVIKAICPYCMLSLLSTTGLFATTLLIRRRKETATDSEVLTG